MALQMMVEWSLCVASVEGLAEPLFLEGSGECPLKGNEDKSLCSHEAKNLCQSSKRTTL